MSADANIISQELQSRLRRWKYVRKVSDKVTDWLKRWESEVKSLTIQLYEATPLAERKATVTAGVQVKKTLKVEVDDTLGEVVAMAVADPVRYGKFLTFNESAMMVLIGLISAGKYPELQSVMMLNEPVYTKWLKEQLNKRVEKKGMTLEGAIKDLGAPLDSADYELSVAITLDNLTAIEDQDPLDGPFIIVPRAGTEVDSEAAPF